jgi:hypothetical protein
MDSQEQVLSMGDVVVSRLNPNIAHIIKRVYGDYADLHRPGEPPICKVPVKLLTKVPSTTPLFALGVPAFGVMWVSAVVVGAKGILAWLAEQDTYTCAKAQACCITMDGIAFMPGDWYAIVDLLDDQEAQPEAQHDAD